MEYPSYREVVEALEEMVSKTTNRELYAKYKPMALSAKKKLEESANRNGWAKENENERT